MEIYKVNNNTSAFNPTEYDDEIKRTLPYYEEFYKQIVDIVNIYNPKNLTWLDIGCGTGKMADIALKQLDIKKFVCCDCSPNMIEIARKRFNCSNTTFLTSDVREIKFVNEFDIITAIQVNHYLHDKEREKSIKKCYQALRAGGLFITFENYAPFSELGKHLYLKRWKAYQLKQGKSENECENHINRYNTKYFPISLSKHFDLLKSCGFNTIEILWLSYMQVGILGIK